MSKIFWLIEEQILKHIKGSTLGLSATMCVQMHAELQNCVCFCLLF